MSIFSKVKVKKPKRSTFNLSHNSKLTLPFGQLIPTYWNYFEPNTNFRASSIIQMRSMPMIAPVMHEINVYSYWFKVPVRLLMEEQDYNDFITGGRTGKVGMFVQEDGVDTNEIFWPKYRINKGNLISIQGKYLLDYLDFPIQQVIDNFGNTDQIEFDAMPLRAYAEIYDKFFRDQNVTAEYKYSKFTGVRDYEQSQWSDIDVDMMKTKPRCWTKDYFTSALPWAQRGEDTPVPFTVLSELAMEGKDVTRVTNVDNDTLANNAQFKRGNLITGASPGSGNKQYEILDSSAQDGVQFDITNHTAVNNRVIGTINDLRTAFSLQRWRERNALGGSRYIEQINAHFGVWADDWRLQRPQYLGGSRIPFQVSEVVQTSESTVYSQQGQPSGRGFTTDLQGNVQCFCKEHCIVMNLICIVPKAAYFQGVPRKFDIRDRYDFPWPLLGHLGEQEVRNKEIFYTGSALTDDSPFGYQSRYSQYKYEPNRIHGEFADSLMFWHLARKFSTAPTLSRQFLEVRESYNGLDRIFPTLTNDDIYYGVNNHFWAQINFNIRVKRPLPYFGTPNL